MGVEKNYLSIVAHYEAQLQQYGDTYRGVDWETAQKANVRYQVMLDLIRPTAGATVSVLDFGCGASHLYDFIIRQQRPGIDYSGLDVSPHFIALSRQKYPDRPYYCVDILDAAVDLPQFDYIIMNGVFTQKLDLSFEEMFAYFAAVIQRVFALTRIGLAFNVGSTHLPWQADQVFHVPFDRLATFLSRHMSRKIVLRHDYDLPDYTVYIYR